MQWEIWRIVSSRHFNASLEEVENRWSVTDLLDAHVTLDLLEEMEVKANTPKGSPNP